MPQDKTEDFDANDMELLERLKVEHATKGPLYTVFFQVDLETLLALTASLGLALSHPGFQAPNEARQRVEAFIDATHASLIANELPAHAQVVARNNPPAPIGDTASHA